MKLLFISFLLIFSFSVSAQEYPFTKDFVKGNIVLRDLTTKSGELKWFPSQDEKLKFRETGSKDTKKYAPEDLMAFDTDTLKFVSLFGFETFAERYPFFGKTSKIKQGFAQLIDSGSFNIYLVFITGYDALRQAIQTYPNFVFERKTDSVNAYAAYPFTGRMKDKRWESAKENLYIFFKDYPDIIAQIKNYKPQDDFYAIINLMKNAN